MSSPGSLTPPQPPSESFDLMRALRILFDDPDWVKKTLFGSLFVALSYLMVGAFFVAGYAVRVLRNAARGEPLPFPEWDDLGGIFQDGLAPVGVAVVYLVGAWLVPGGCFVAMIAVGSLGSDSAGPVMALLGLLAYALLFVCMLAFGILFPAAFTRMVLQDRFSAAFEFGEIIAYIKRNVGNYLLAIVAYLIASFIAQFGILLLCIGILPAMFWANMVTVWSLGEVARLDSGS